VAVGLGGHCSRTRSSFYKNNPKVTLPLLMRTSLCSFFDTYSRVIFFLQVLSFSSFLRHMNLEERATLNHYDPINESFVQTTADEVSLKDTGVGTCAMFSMLKALAK